MKNGDSILKTNTLIVRPLLPHHYVETTDSKYSTGEDYYGEIAQVQCTYLEAHPPPTISLYTPVHYSSVESDYYYNFKEGPPIRGEPEEPSGSPTSQRITRASVGICFVSVPKEHSDQPLPTDSTLGNSVKVDTDEKPLQTPNQERSRNLPVLQRSEQKRNRPGAPARRRRKN